MERDLGWTERIRDRSLRSEVEAVLRILMREAKVARSDKTRLASAKPVEKCLTLTIMLFFMYSMREGEVIVE